MLFLPPNTDRGWGHNRELLEIEVVAEVVQEVEVMEEEGLHL